ncbi:MAG TPA: hypothetical protein VFP91_03265 [Vicinamibacterales bacterium]|nr:hypothetical protein [Vicinamibacterales bacterium]
MGWWDFAVRAFALLTTPRADVARCDRDVEALARGSAVGGVLHAASLAVRREWAGSRARSTVETLAAAAPAGDAATWRLAGWVVAVAGVSVLVFNPFATRNAGPLIVVAPALLVVAGLFAMACAAPLARAAADRRRRSPSPTQ